MNIARRWCLLIFAAVTGFLILSTPHVNQIQKVFVVANYANEDTIPSLRDLDTASAALDARGLLVWKSAALRDDAVQAHLIEQRRAALLQVVAALDTSLPPRCAIWRNVRSQEAAAA